MKNFNLYLCIGVLLVFVGCSKDKNMDDYRNDQLQQSISRITAISGSYSGAVISKIDGTSLGDINLKFRASTDIQSGSGNVSNSQNAIVSGSLSLKSLSNIDVSFDNGFYDDKTGIFQVSIPTTQANGVMTKISLNGHISGDNWIGTIEVNGQPQNGADLNLTKNAVINNSSALEVSGTRLEQMRRLDHKFSGTYTFGNEVSPFTLNFTSKDVFPEQNLFKLFSPIRQVSVNCDLTAYELNFKSAILDDNLGTLVASDPIDLQGHVAVASLSCNRFETLADFGWNCEIKMKNALVQSHLSAKK